MPDGNASQDVRKLEMRRFEALVQADVSALAYILADDLTYTHSNGVHETKTQFLNRLQSGQLKYELFQPEEMTVRIYGDTAVINGIARGKAWAEGRLNGFRLRYTDVYVKTGELWRMVAWESTRLQ